MNQLLTYIINERLMELVEHERILTQAQDSFHQDKSTDINTCKLYVLTRETQRRFKRRFLRVDIDFQSAFNSISVKITFNTGVAQGSVLSPLLFSLFINALSLYLSDIPRKQRIHHGLPGTQPFNHIFFTDDMTQ
jgi:hypothetical protein